MGNRFYSQFPERKLPGKEPDYKGAKPGGGKGETGSMADADPGYKGLPTNRKRGMGRAAGFPDIKVNVKEAYDGNGPDRTRYSRGS